MAIIDISQKLSHNTPEWPGDVPFEFKFTATIGEKSASNVGMITTTAHIGTHIDAPYHYDNDGKKVHELDLDLYVGIARVIDVSGHQEIGVEEIKDADLTNVKRLLLRTNYWKDRSQFPYSFPNLKPEIAPYLAEKGVKLIGVDVPSVDALHNTKIDAHLSLNKYDIHILEGIVLDDVECKDYELIALPLFIEDGDGSPVRAVLREL